MTSKAIIPGADNIPIALDPASSADGAAIEDRIRRVVRSVRFQVSEDQSAFSILGPDMSYHDADPLLAHGLEFIRPGMSIGEIAGYREMRGVLALCLEDCWSGYFIAPIMAGLRSDEDLILIHLDDHTDMMPTLLEQIDGTLIDPTYGCIFDPACADSWSRSIGSGCVSIGNFITPLFHGGPRVHVRHLNNAGTETSPQFDVRRSYARYDIIPDKLFATIDWAASDGHAPIDGSYQVGPDATGILAELPGGRVVVHIDFDYFINDFNGNIVGDLPLSPERARATATPKLDAFFAALKDSGVTVDRWILATSPGFCSGRHWRWLFEAITNRIGDSSGVAMADMATVSGTQDGPAERTAT